MMQKYSLFILSLFIFSCATTTSQLSKNNSKTPNTPLAPVIFSVNGYNNKLLYGYNNKLTNVLEARNGFEYVLPENAQGSYPRINLDIVEYSGLGSNCFCVIFCWSTVNYKFTSASDG